MKYKANPIIVDGFKITAIGNLTQNGNMLITTDDGLTRQADAPMLSRIIPTIGDYWVIQEDGYEYLNPKAVFERKYSPAL
jgi:hypothetical protein